MFRNASIDPLHQSHVIIIEVYPQLIIWGYETDANTSGIRACYRYCGYHMYAQSAELLPADWITMYTHI